ncbi:hypothetical protein D8674_009711 [Pyrus ussuriensis x Pyrus communis]|uniref:Uncharacterized protein n=1 Tax=Pyrus ussuriensis x Pyrus communis TaxID=2448454 RepID=A0A5N5FE45_9ROSA|nr:hypothetical protein D8674_009711 [Pyrus ussuriensis x Pyrus communis]
MQRKMRQREGFAYLHTKVCKSVCLSNPAPFHFVFLREPSLFSTAPLALPKAETKPSYAEIKSQVSDTHRAHIPYVYIGDYNTFRESQPASLASSAS